jgi:deazaflavin-dependent oxidoreductase (nitroreductase family)
MAESSESSALSGWTKDQLGRYVATDGTDGYLWDASLAGVKGMVPTLLLTTMGRRSGKVLTLPMIFGRSGPNYVVAASRGGAPTHPAWYFNLEGNPEQVRGAFTAGTRSTGPRLTDRIQSWC